MNVTKKLDTINNIDIYYEYYNDSKTKKPLLIFIHGFLSSTFCYRKLIPLLLNDYTILSIDIPPFGKSYKGVKITYSYGTMAHIIHLLIMKFKYKKATLIGHSMGGQIALFTAKEYEEQIDKLILLCSSGYLPSLSKTLRLATYLPFSTKWIRTKLEKQGVEKNLRLCVYNHSLVDKEMINGYGEPFTNPQIFSALKRFARDREGDLTPQELRHIKTPTLLIWGEEDKVVPIEKGRKLHKDLENSLLITYPKTGHLLPEEKPEQVANDIIQFLSQSQN